MRRICFLLCVLMLSIASNAQVVMGINIKTKMSVFNDAMSKKGYKPVVTTLGNYEYIVTFAGYPYCKYSVEYNTDTDSIYCATIIFSHESISKDGEIYAEMKRQLIAKYGKPSYDFDVDYADLSAMTMARMSYRNVSFNYKPYMIWNFGDEEQNVKISYQTGVSRKVKKVAVSTDL